MVRTTSISPVRRANAIAAALFGEVDTTIPTVASPPTTSPEASMTSETSAFRKIDVVRARTSAASNVA